MPSPRLQDLDRWPHETLERYRRQADDEADAAVAAIGDPTEVNRLMRELVLNDDIPSDKFPPAIQRFLDETGLPLDDADLAQVKAGQDFFEGLGPQICMTLLCAALPASYAGAKQAKVLHYTGRLQNDVKRRISETAQFVVEVMKQDSLSPGGAGIRVIQKVRLMHAFVRRRIKDDIKKDPTIWNMEWGEPINQEDMLAGLLCFSIVPVLALRKLGARVPTKDAEAYLGAWKVIGRLMGIKAEYIPETERDARALSLRIKFRHFEASREGKDLTAALVEMCQDMTPDPLDSVPPQLMVYLLGRRTGALLGLPVTPFSPLTALVTWLSAVALPVLSRFPKVRIRIGRRVLDNAIRRIAGTKQVQAFFELPGRVVRRANEICGLAGERITQAPFVPRDAALRAKTQSNGLEVLRILPYVSRKGRRTQFEIPNTAVAALKDDGARGGIRSDRVRTIGRKFDKMAADHLAAVAQQPMPAEMAGFGAPVGRPWSAALQVADVLLAHWPVDGGQIGESIGGGLRVETFAGRAWLTVAAMRVVQAQIPGGDTQTIDGRAVSLPLVRINLAAVGVYTYVTGQDGLGMYFLDIDVSDAYVDRVASEHLRLKTSLQDVSLLNEGGWTTVRSRELQSNGQAPADRLRCRYRRTGGPLRVDPDTLDAFLDSPRVLYLPDLDGGAAGVPIAAGGVDLYDAEGRIDTMDLLTRLGIQVPNTSGKYPVLRYVPATELIVGAIPYVPEAPPAISRS